MDHLLPPSRFSPKILWGEQTLDQLLAERAYWDEEAHTRTETIGLQLAVMFRDHCAEWARGGQPSPRSAGHTPGMASTSAATLAPSQETSNAPDEGAGTLPHILQSIDDELAKAAQQGTAALAAEWKTLLPHDQARLKERLDTIHKPTARMVDEKEGVPS